MKVLGGFLWSIHVALFYGCFSTHLQWMNFWQLRLHLQNFWFDTFLVIFRCGKNVGDLREGPLHDIPGDMYTFRYPKQRLGDLLLRWPSLQPICVTWGFVSEFGNHPKPVLLQQGKHVGIEWIWAKYWDTRIWYVYNAITTSHEWHLFRCFSDASTPGGAGPFPMSSCHHSQKMWSFGRRCREHSFT